MSDQLGWDTFWVPLIIRSVVGAVITAIVGGIVGFYIRRWLNEFRKQLRGTDAKVTKTALDAASTKVTSEDVERRFMKLEAGFEAWRKSMDAELGHRARTEVRFKRLEEKHDD